MIVFKMIGKGFQFYKKIKAFEQTKRDLPLRLGNMAKNHFLLGFRKGGYQTAKSINGWPKRKVDPPGKERKILIGKGSGILRGDIKVREYKFNRIVVGTSAATQDYAEIHNKGLQGKAFGKYTFKMPRREFIGRSVELHKKIKNKINSVVKRSMYGR